MKLKVWKPVFTLKPATKGGGTKVLKRGVFFFKKRTVLDNFFRVSMSLSLEVVVEHPIQGSAPLRGVACGVD